MIDRWLGGGILGGLGLTWMVPEWPTLAANQVQFAVNAVIGLGSFVVSFILSMSVPATATFTLPSFATAIIPAAVGMLATTALLVFKGVSA